MIYQMPSVDIATPYKFSKQFCHKITEINFIL